MANDASTPITLCDLKKKEAPLVEKVFLHGTTTTIDLSESPTFLGIRQKDFFANITCDVSVDREEAGLTFMMDETHHYDIGIQQKEDSYYAFLRVQIGNIVTVRKEVLLCGACAKLQIHSKIQSYEFQVVDQDKTYSLGTVDNRYLSSEVCGGFTGIVIGLYAQTTNDFNLATFCNFNCTYLDDQN